MERLRRHRKRFRPNKFDDKGKRGIKMDLKDDEYILKIKGNVNENTELLENN